MFVDRLMSQTADENISSSVGMFQCVICYWVLAFYPRDAMLARVIGTATCPSVMRRYCVKTKKASGMVSSPSDSPKTLVFWRQI